MTAPFGFVPGARVVVMPYTPEADCGTVADALWDEEGDEIPEGFVPVTISNGQGTWGFPPASVRVCPPGSDRLGNLRAKEGQDRCACGAKYWEFDRCVDCLEPVANAHKM